MGDLIPGVSHCMQMRGDFQASPLCNHSVGTFQAFPAMHMRGDVPGLPRYAHAWGRSRPSPLCTCVGTFQAFPAMHMRGDVPGLPRYAHAWGRSRRSPLSTCVGTFQAFPTMHMRLAGKAWNRGYILFVCVSESEDYLLLCGFYGN